MKQSLGEYCCKGFKNAVKAAEAREVYATAFEYQPKDKTWNVWGCCGGHCYVIFDMKFCPLCGASCS